METDIIDNIHSAGENNGEEICEDDNLVIEDNNDYAQDLLPECNKEWRNIEWVNDAIYDTLQEHNSEWMKSMIYDCYDECKNGINNDKIVMMPDILNLRMISGYLDTCIDHVRTCIENHRKQLVDSNEILLLSNIFDKEIDIVFDNYYQIDTNNVWYLRYRWSLQLRRYNPPTLEKLIDKYLDADYCRINFDLVKFINENNDIVITLNHIVKDENLYREFLINNNEFVEQLKSIIREYLKKTDKNLGDDGYIHPLEITNECLKDFLTYIGYKYREIVYLDE